MDCVIFLTHHFNAEFIKQLRKIDNDANLYHYKVIVLFDKENEYDETINGLFKSIKIIKINRINTSYHNGGHSMYINYFRQNYEEIQKYRYFWIIENNVYYPDCFIDFFHIHEPFNYDLMVSEYGVRSTNWCWTSSLSGFSRIQHIGVLAVISRFSQRLLFELIDGLDNVYEGYLEAFLPHLCLEQGLSIQQFLPEMCGIMTGSNNFGLMNLVKNDILKNRRDYLETKIYYPFEL